MIHFIVLRAREQGTLNRELKGSRLSKGLLDLEMSAPRQA